MPFFYVDLQLFEIVCLSYAFHFFFFFFVEVQRLKEREATEIGFCTGLGSYWLPDVLHMK